jgi:hypothetical protein
MGRDGAKDSEALTQSTIMYIQSRPFAVEVEGSGKYKHSAHQAANYSSHTNTHTHTHTQTHTHTHTHVVSGSGKHHKSTPPAKQGVPSTIHKGGFTHSMPRPCRAAKGLECVFPI